MNTCLQAEQHAIILPISMPDLSGAGKCEINLVTDNEVTVHATAKKYSILMIVLIVLAASTKRDILTSSVPAI